MQTLPCPYQPRTMSAEVKQRHQRIAVTIIGLVLVVAAAGWFVLDDFLPTEREASLYRAGDCVQFPVIDKGTLERWQEPQFNQLYMISDVGEHRYRVREWGTRRSAFPQWYEGYQDYQFKTIDDRKVFMPVPCPEQGPDPENERADSPLSSSFTGASVGNEGDTTYWSSVTTTNNPTAFR